jgi:mono/diheme cytochrome c family protein
MCLLLIPLLIVLAPGATLAADTQVEPGRAMYLRYCGACHGPNGTGDGVVGSLMRPKPPDLTLLGKRNGGEFPFHQVMEFIDGQRDIRAHGDPVMPVWGEIFRAEATWDQGRRAEVQGKLMQITGYLRSIQVK